MLTNINIANALATVTANNHFQAADGSYANCTENGINFAIIAQGNTGGTFDLNDAGLSFTPDIGDGRLGVSVTKDGATFNASLDGTGTINFSTNGIITIPKDFSLNFNAITYTGIPLAGTIYGDGVNDIQATLVNGSQIAFTTNGAVGANLNLGEISFGTQANKTQNPQIVIAPTK